MHVDEQRPEPRKEPKEPARYKPRTTDREFFERLGRVGQVSGAPRHGPGMGWRWLRFAIPALALAGVGVVVWAVPKPTGIDWAFWKSSGPATEHTAAAALGGFALSARCVSGEGVVLGEAAPGETLTCQPGAFLQLRYSARSAAELHVSGPGGMRFYPREGQPARVEPGENVGIPFVTPVTAKWLGQPLELKARFTLEDGTRAESKLRLAPE